MLEGKEGSKSEGERCRFVCESFLEGEDGGVGGPV